MRTNPVKIAAADRLAASSESFIEWLLPGGKWSGAEYIVRNPTRSDKKPGSFSINRNGKWGDFATKDKGNDLLSLFCYIKGYEDDWEAVKNLPAEYASTGSSQPKRSQKQKAKSDLVSIIPDQDKLPNPDQVKYKNLRKVGYWPYRTVEGQVFCYVFRFEDADGKKEYPVYSAFRDSKGEVVWRWKKPSFELMPLYRADEVAKAKAVLLVEGEKSVDAAQELFPSVIATTTMGGANRGQKADFSILAGKRVTIWPDNDEPGLKHAWQVKRLIEAAGGIVEAEGESGILNPEALHPDGNPPPKWDAANALSEGQTSKSLSALAKERAASFCLREPARPADAQWMDDACNKILSDHGFQDSKTTRIKKEPIFAYAPGDRYELNDHGVFYKPVAGDSERSSSPMWVCSPLKILGYCADENGGHYSVMVSLQDRQGAWKNSLVPMADIVGRGGTFLKQLADLGLKVGVGERPRTRLAEYLQHGQTESFTRLVGTTGWHGSAFVLPDRIIGQYTENDKPMDICLAESFAFPPPSGSAGTLEEWKERVASLARGNSRPMFAISAALAGPLLAIANEDSGGFNLFGPSSTGKTTCLRVAQSVWSDPRAAGTWNGTSNGLKAASAASSDRLLVLDELSEAEDKALNDAVYGMGNTSPKFMANHWGGAALRRTLNWRTITLSSGELRVKDEATRRRLKANAGQEVRLVDIPVENFENLHGFDDANAFVQEFRLAYSQFYGTLGPAFVAKCIEERGRLADRIKVIKRDFTERFVSGDSIGQVKRVGGRFATVAAAGELATEWGITGWQPGEAMEAAGQCYRDWLDQRGGTGLIEEMNLIAHVTHYLEQHGESQFPLLSSRRMDSKTIYHAGYRDDEGNFLIFPESFKQRVIVGNLRFAIKVLTRRGLLIPYGSESMHVKRVGPNKSAKRVYIISSRILS